MRTGINPNRHAKVSPPPPVVISVITHLPEMESDYHRNRLDVIKLCISSMTENAGMDASLLVWDNGSCADLVDWLRYEAKPHYLVLSDNVGKWQARSSILRMFPPATVIGISDDDMLFYPGWLHESMRILTIFPNVGVVSGYPVRTQFRWGCNNTRQWALKNAANFESGKLIPEQWDRDFCTSIGRSWEDQVRGTENDIEYRATYRGCTVYLTGHHCQFICYAGRLLPFLSWSDEAMPDEKPFDQAIDNAGLLRLTTKERYARHIGNVIDDDIKTEIQFMGMEVKI